MWNGHFKGESLVAMKSSSEKVKPKSQGSRRAGRNKYVPEHSSGFQVRLAEPISMAVARRQSDIDK